MRSLRDEAQRFATRSGTGMSGLLRRLRSPDTAAVLLGRLAYRLGSSVTRPVDVTPAGATDLVITRSLDAPRRHVFAALTTPDLVRQWLGPPEWQMTTCAIDLRVSGRYRYEFAGPRGVAMGFGGVFTEIVASERIVSTEAFDDAPPGSDTVNTLLLTERNGVTTLVTTVRYPTEAARAAAVATGMTDGMTAGYRRLDAVLASERAGD